MDRRTDQVADLFARLLAVGACLLATAVIAGGCAAAGRPVDPSPTAAPSGPSASSGAIADATIAAQDLAFDRPELVVPDGRPFELTFDNRDRAPHNVAIIDVGGTTVFSGEIFSGPAVRRYAVPALAAGHYRFRCDLHPDMAGTLIAGSTAAIGDADP